MTDLPRPPLRPLEVVREANRDQGVRVDRDQLHKLAEYAIASEHLAEAVFGLAAILRKLAAQFRPLGLTAPYEKDLQDLDVALAKLRRR